MSEALADIAKSAVFATKLLNAELLPKHRTSSKALHLSRKTVGAAKALVEQCSSTALQDQCDFEQFPNELEAQQTLVV